MKDLKVIYARDCWGDDSFFGFINGQQYTDAYSYLPDLIEDYPIFKKAKVIDQTK